MLRMNFGMKIGIMSCKKHPPELNPIISGCLIIYCIPKIKNKQICVTKRLNLKMSQIAILINVISNHFYFQKALQSVKIINQELYERLI